MLYKIVFSSYVFPYIFQEVGSALHSLNTSCLSLFFKWFCHLSFARSITCWDSAYSPDSIHRPGKAVEQTGLYGGHMDLPKKGRCDRLCRWTGVHGDDNRRDPLAERLWRLAEKTGIGGFGWRMHYPNGVDYFYCLFSLWSPGSG